MAFFSQEQKTKIQPAIKALLKEYGLTGSLSVRHHSTVILTISKGLIDFIGKYEKKDYWGRESQEEKKPDYLGFHKHSDFKEIKDDKAVEFLKKALDILMSGNHDNSDIMSDYHDVGWYVDINIGKWDKPYVYIS